MSEIVTYAALQQLCRPDGPPPRMSTVCRWAEREGIRYRYDASGGIWTTVLALNAALGMGQPELNYESEEHLI